MQQNNNTIRVRVNAELRSQTESILNEMGISMTQAVSLLFKYISATEELPFPIKIYRKEHSMCHVEQSSREPKKAQRPRGVLDDIVESIRKNP